MTSPERTPADFFLRYLLLGLLLLMGLVFGAKRLLLSNPPNPNAYEYLAGGIFAVNFIVVLGFTMAIVRAPLLLADQDAPDLAYYLGFSLTVGALAATFLSEITLQSVQSSQGRSHVITGALAQFGAGLLATLFGLCAKIFLNARQQRGQVDPETFYRRLRIELKEISLTIRSMSRGMTSSIEGASNSIRAAGKSAQDAMKELAESLSKSAKIVATSVTPEKIERPIKEFIAELERMSLPLESLQNAMLGLQKSAQGLTAGLDSTTGAAKAAVDTATNAGHAIAAVSAAAVHLKEEIGQLINVISNHAAAEVQVAGILDKSAQQSVLLTVNMKGLESSVGSLGKSMDESRELLVDSLSQTSSQFVELRTEVGKVTPSIAEVAKRVSDLQPVIGALSLAMTTLNSATTPVAGAVTSIHAPLNQTKISLEEFQRIISAVAAASQLLQNSVEALEANVRASISRSS